MFEHFDKINDKRTLAMKGLFGLNRSVDSSFIARLLASNAPDLEFKYKNLQTNQFKDFPQGASADMIDDLSEITLAHLDEGQKFKLVKNSETNKFDIS